MPYLQRHGVVFVLNLGEQNQTDAENRFSPGWVSTFEECLDEVESTTGAAALVTTGNGKFYSNGFEPERFTEPRTEVLAYLGSVQRLWARLLTFPMVTVAAIQGHAFAGGLLLALSHDARVMRADRGFLCLPEVDLGFPFPAPMAALVQARLPIATAHEAMTTGRRYGGPDALEVGMVDAISAEAELLPSALNRAGALAGKRGPTIGAIKETVYRGVLSALRADLV